MGLTLLVVNGPLDGLWLLHGQLNRAFIRLRVTSLQVLRTVIDQVVILAGHQDILMRRPHINLLATAIPVLLTAACQPHLIEIGQRLL